MSNVESGPMLVQFVKGHWLTNEDGTRKFIRGRKHGRCYGAVVAISATKIGWSYCSKTEKFDRERALELARIRAFNDKGDGKFGANGNNHNGESIKVPIEFARFIIPAMQTRAESFFK